MLCQGTQKEGYDSLSHDKRTKPIPIENLLHFQICLVDRVDEEW